MKALEKTVPSRMHSVLCGKTSHDAISTEEDKERGYCPEVSRRRWRTVGMGGCLCVLWLMCVLCSCIARVSDASPLTVSELIQHISDSEEALRACEADFAVYFESTGEPYWEGTWGYEDRKGFLRGRQHAVRPDGTKFAYEEVFAFDGERLFTYQPEPDRANGNVRELDTDLDTRLSPQMLLGYSIRGRGRYRLSEVLGQGEDSRILSVDESIDGNSCILLQSIVPMDVMQTEETVPVALRVWIDPVRNYRPRRIEQFRDPEAQYLLVVYDDILLDQVDGLWLPESGRRTVYTTIPVPLGGHTLEEVRSMTGEELRENLEFVVRPSEGGTKRIRVFQWRVLQDIDDSKFKVEFPPGSRVWDDYAQVNLEI